MPEIGINDVLIRVHKTGICGTDLHIYDWDAWAQRTIPVPMVIGHEFVGEIVERRLERERLRGRRPRQRRGPRRLRALPQLHGRPTASVRALDRPRRAAARRVRRVRRAADDERLAPEAGSRRGRRRDLRPVRQRRAHRADLPRARRGRARSRAPARSAAWRPPSCATPARATSSSPTRTTTGSSWRAGWARRWRSTRPSATLPTCSASSA